jgi:outer membrane protein TolC
LNILTGLQLSPDNIFIIPSQSTPLNTQNKRPELGLFDLQISKVNLLKDMMAIKRKPMVMGFGQAGYGRPALNMLSNDFEPYFAVGAKLSWKVFDWGNNKKEQKSLDLKSQIISKKKEAFNTQLEVILTKKLTEIKRLENFLVKDEQIVGLKAKVAKAASSQFENGQITATDYLLEKNAETKAILNSQLHRVQLRHAQIDYEYSLGNLNN